MSGNRLFLTVLAAMVALRAQVAGGIDVNDDITFGELAKMWLDVYRAPYVRVNTMKNNRSKINKHLMPRLACLPVKEITALQIQAVVTDMVEAGYNEANSVIKLMRDIFDVGVDIGCIMKSPVPTSLKAPPRQSAKPKQILSREMEANILRHLKPLSRERMFFQCGVHTGCRRGEIYGLMWDCIDLENDIIYIRRQVIHDNSGHPMIENVLKTESGRREVPITPTLHKELELWGEWYGREGLVFVTPEGEPLSVGPVNWVWNTIRKAAAKYNPEYSKKFTAHSMCHTYITRLFEAGLDIKEIQTLAGHKDVTTTLSVYTHFDKEGRQQSTFAKVRNAFSGQPVDAGTEKVTSQVEDKTTGNTEPEEAHPTIIQLPLRNVVNH